MFRLRIKELLLEKGKREKRRVTLREMAHACGISYTSASTWARERGIPSISAESTAALMEFFGLKPEELYKLIEFEPGNEDELARA